MANPQPPRDEPTQALRDRLAAAIEAPDLAATAELLSQDPRLANADLRQAEDRDHFTNGLPLFRACQRGHGELAELLLDHGAHPDAHGSEPDEPDQPGDAEDPPELGLPLHFCVEAGDWRLANLLLDRGATPKGYSYCDQATIERVYYLAREAGASDELVRRAYASYLPDREALEATRAADLVEASAPAPVRLFARMVDLGGQAPFCAIVRDGLDGLALEAVVHDGGADGTPHDHPRSSAFDNVFGAARWHGYPKLVRSLMRQCPERFSYAGVLDTLDVAIRSHNRDGDYAAYREIIVMQLEWLQSQGELDRARNDPAFQPLHRMATDFTWDKNYGYKAEIAAPECFVDLAELFVSWGFEAVDHVDPQSGLSTLAAARQRGHHPGIDLYTQWLRSRGAV